MNNIKSQGRTPFRRDLKQNKLLLLSKSSNLESKKDQLKSEDLYDVEEEDIDIKTIQKSIPSYILNPYGTFCKIWSSLMIALLIYTGIVLPPRLAFDDESGINWFYVDIIIDSLFISDILVNFFSAFEDQDGQLICDRKKIALNYITGWFAIDITSSIPVYLILNPTNETAQTAGGSVGNYNNVLRLSRIPRIYKLAKVFRVIKLMNGGTMQQLLLFLRLNDEYTKIIKFSIITLILLHTFGCIWYFIGSLNDDSNWILSYNYSDEPIHTKYIASLYYILTVLATVGYGNILPINEGERIFTIIFMFFAVMIFSYIMGILTYSFSKLNEKTMLIKEREVFFNEMAAAYKLNIEMHENLIKNIQSCVNSQEKQLLEKYKQEAIFKELPPAMLGEVCTFIFKDVIKTVNFFQEKPKDFLRKLFPLFQPIYLSMGDEIYHKGQMANEIYFIIKGRVVTRFEDKSGVIKTLVHVQGSYFGEADVIFKRNRAENALAEDQAEVWKVYKEDFMMLLDEFEYIKKEIFETAGRKDQMMMQGDKLKIENNIKSENDKIEISHKECNNRAKEQLLKSLSEKDNIQMSRKDLDQLLGIKSYLREIKTSLGIDTNNKFNPKDNEIEELISKAIKVCRSNQIKKK